MKFDLYTIHLKLILQEELNFFQTFFSAMLANYVNENQCRHSAFFLTGC